MSWSTANIPDLTGKTAVVTGANGGLGLETARGLAGAGARVVMAARDQEKAAKARQDILGTHPDALLEIVELDLGSLDSVNDAAAKIIAVHGKVDILINNAGVMAMPERRTRDGFESQLGINHLGHWALTARLLPVLLQAEPARIVTVTSTAHHGGHPVDGDNPNMEGSYDPWRAYARSKLANYHFALGLNREFEKHNLPAASLVAHPGLSNTNLQAHTVAESDGDTGGVWLSLVRRFGMEPAQGALPQLRAATDQRAEGGQMYAPRYVNFGPPVRRPILRRIGLDDAIDNLWRVSEELTGIRLDVESALETA